MKVVLDTNVLIAALIARGVCSELLEHCAARHEVVGSEFILSELAEQLLRKFGYEGPEADEAVSLIRSTMKLVAPEKLEIAVCRDPDDDAILATAVAGNADCIVTGDEDLLVLESFRNIRILRPAQFARYEAEGRI